MAEATFPELEHGSGSWIVTSPTGIVFELFDRTNARSAFGLGWLVETAGQYLGRVSKAHRPDSQMNTVQSEQTTVGSNS